MADNPRKILVLAAEVIAKDAKFLVSEFFTAISALISYVDGHLTTTDEFILFVPEDVIQDLIRSGIHDFAQVNAIYVFCRNYDYRRPDRRYIDGVRYEKLRFFHEQQLLQTIEGVIQTPPRSSITDDRTNAHRVSSLIEQQVHLKRSKPSSYSEPKSKRQATTPCLNIDSVESRYSCSACKLFLCDPHQLECGHRICLTCLEYKDNSMTCITCGESSLKENIRRDRAIHNDMQQLSVCCCECNWTGLLKSYQAHLNQMHLNAESDSTNCVVNKKQKTEQRTSYNKTSQGLMSNIVSSSSVNDTQTNVNQHLKILSRIKNIIARLSETRKIIQDNQKQFNVSYGRQTLLKVADNNLSAINGNFEANINFANGTEIHHDLPQQEILSSQQGLEEAELTSDNGSITWKISNLAKKIVDAKTERQISIYSPPFYSSAGYKMCLRLYLNGDNHTRDTHVSLFFVLMRGDHDAMLQWPFSNKTTFCLLDQSTSNDNRRDISRNFWPDKTLKCLQRPDSEMNEGYGIKKFVSLEQLERDRALYVCNDTMIIKSTIDFMNEPPDHMTSFDIAETPYDEDHVGAISENFKYID